MLWPCSSVPRHDCSSWGPQNSQWLLHWSEAQASGFPDGRQTSGSTYRCRSPLQSQPAPEDHTSLVSAFLSVTKVTVFIATVLHSKHPFLATSPKIPPELVTTLKGHFYLSAAVHWQCQYPLKGLGTMEAAQHPRIHINMRYIHPR